MNNYREICISLAKRLILAISAGGTGWWLLATKAGGWESTPYLLFGLACIVCAAIIIAAPLARLIAEPGGNLFYPDRRFSRPQPIYSIPESKRTQGLYEEAIAGFEKIAADYPDQVKPYIDMIDISIVNLKDPNRANEIFQLGIASLKRDQDKEALSIMYSAIRTRLNSRISN